ncbi:hypothetical protein D3C72_1999540 [compost metagenome]
MGAVQQQQPAQVQCGLGTVDRARETFPDEPGQIARMVEVGMRQHHGLDFRGRDGKWRPVAQPQRLHALEQPAIQQNQPPAGIEQVA